MTDIHDDRCAVTLSNGKHPCNCAMAALKPKLQPCNMCGRPVASFFDHVDVDCLNWPSPDDEGKFGQAKRYRDFDVSLNLDAPMACAFQWVHKDYDGDEDNRHGSEASYEDCYRAIDEWHEDNA